MEQLAVQLVLAIKLRRKATLMVRLEEAARDNELLVHEVRHRVKNMIQMTSGLLQLQERGTQAVEAQVALREAQSRLLVLSNVYEALLEPRAQYRHVDAGSLIERLVAALRESTAAATEVSFQVDCEKLFLGVSNAVPVGLIVNEAVTNALSTPSPVIPLAKFGLRLHAMPGNARFASPTMVAASLALPVLEVLV